MKKLYIGGYNVVTPDGMGIEKLIGKSLSEFNGSFLEPITLNVDHLLNKYNRLPYHTRLACASMQEACSMANIQSNLSSKDIQTGIIVATTVTNLSPINNLHEDMLNYGFSKINPRIFPNTVLNSISGYGAILLGFTGANITISEGLSSGMKAVEYAHDLLITKALKRVVVCEMNVRVPEPFSGNMDFRFFNESVVSIILQHTEDGAIYELDNNFPSHKKHLDPHFSNSILDIIYKIKSTKEIDEKGAVKYR